MRRHLLALLALATAAGLVVAACGGAAPASAPATAAPSAPTAAPASAPATAAPSAPATPAGPGAAVTIAGFAFDPAILKVKVGSTVTWSNADSAAHTVVWDDGTPGSDRLATGGAAYRRTFDTPGTFAYACGIHPSMKGTVVVEP